MDTVARDVRYAWRRIWRSRGFTAVAVLSLALGIGANTAIFTIVDELLLGDAPFADPDSLVEVYPSDDGHVGLNALSNPELKDIEDGTAEVFEGIAGTSFAIVQEGFEGGSETLVAEVVTGNYFDVLGLKPQIGRTFLPEEDATLNTHPVVVLSHSYWQRRFAGNPDAAGQSLRLNGREYTVIGVASADTPSLMPGMEPALWAPMKMVNHLKNNSRNQLEARGSHSILAKARLKEGVSIEQAQAVIDRVITGVHKRFPEYPDTWGITLVPTGNVAIHPLLDRVLFPGSAVLMAVVGMVLVIACVNLTSFLLARATDRRREIAIRLSLGAGRASLMRQLLTETVMLSLMGGAAGVAVAWGALRLLADASPPGPVPLNLSMTPDGSVLLFSLGLSVAAGLLFGLIPAFQSTKPDVAPVLKDEGVVRGRPGRFNLRNALVVAQVAVSFLLLIGSGLFLRSLQEAQSADPGFGSSPTSIVEMALPADRYQGEAALRFYENLRREVSAMPAVESLGMIDVIPLTGTSFNGMGITVEGVPPPPGNENHGIDRAIIDDHYLEAAGVPLVEGRTFGPQDELDAPPSAIVSQAFVERFWPGEPGVGKSFKEDETVYRIIGVARDTNVRALGENPLPYIYLAQRQRPANLMCVMASTAVPTPRLQEEMVRAARGLEPGVIIIQTKSMDDHLAFMLFPFRFAGGLLAVMGVLALLLASIGLYGVLRYSVAGRLREMGIRKSLGADTASVLKLIMSEGLGLVAVGMVLGILMALAATPVIGALLFAVAPLDLATYVVVLATLALTAVGAVLGPALRAARVHPVEALRQV